MQKFVAILLSLLTFSQAQVSDKEIANMFILGFYGGEDVVKSDICRRGLGGVILFQKSPIKKGEPKNFSSKSELKSLTKALKSCSKRPLIAIDQEGGLVQRVKFRRKYLKASEVKKRGKEFAKREYSAMAKELRDLGINLNFAPVVDLEANRKNRVIVKFGRSYGDVDDVVEFASIFIDSMHRFGIATTLKHFPGHGSSLGDTHKGFVDVTNLWSQRELIPFQRLSRKSDAVMVAHIYNKRLDAKLPASLSRYIVTDLLRGKVGFRGVVISDDLQMGAISRYSLRDRVKYSINAGVDIMLFANQVHKRDVIRLKRLISIVRGLLNRGEINEESIKEANIRIDSLKRRLYR